VVVSYNLAKSDQLCKLADLKVLCNSAVPSWWWIEKAHEVVLKSQTAGIPFKIVNLYVCVTEESALIVVVLKNVYHCKKNGTAI